MSESVIKSPSKINIGLNILEKREDGYHNIETIFYPLDLYDELFFEEAGEYSFTSNDEKLNKEPTNLITKAKELLESLSEIKLNIKIRLHKNIPIGAGLGGGSSNAAATLLALNDLYNLNISKNDLSKLALKLGSDVPFFLNPVPSFAESRGEILFPIKMKIKSYILIVNPGIHISTKWAFSMITPGFAETGLKSIIQHNNSTMDDIMKIAVNDFEKIVFKNFPPINEIKNDMLRFGAKYSLMTGTGSTVWGIFEEDDSVKKAELFFRSKNYFTFIQIPI